MATNKSTKILPNNSSGLLQSNPEEPFGKILVDLFVAM